MPTVWRRQVRDTDADPLTANVTLDNPRPISGVSSGSLFPEVGTETKNEGTSKLFPRVLSKVSCVFRVSQTSL